jgi:hypothetical protein
MILADTLRANSAPAREKKRLLVQARCAADFEKIKAECVRCSLLPEVEPCFVSDAEIHMTPALRTLVSGEGILFEPEDRRGGWLFSW